MSYASPVCGASLDPVPRYQRQICPDCANKAVAIDGHPLQFSDNDLPDGFEECHGDTGEAFASHARWITGIPCDADKSHFGGMVIEVEA